MESQRGGHLPRITQPVRTQITSEPVFLTTELKPFLFVPLDIESLILKPSSFSLYMPKSPSLLAVSQDITTLRSSLDPLWTNLFLCTLSIA